MASPEEMAQKMIDNMPEKTGKSLEEWQVITRAAGIEKHGALVKMLKSEHGMTHGFANLVAHKTLQAEKPADQDLVGAQYAGAKADLKPIYDRLITAAEAFGDDIEISPKKAYVSLRRSKQFALIQPSTRTRVDLGLNLKGDAPNERLEASVSFNAMCSHRIRLSSVEDVDDEAVAYLEQAYLRA